VKGKPEAQTISESIRQRRHTAGVLESAPVPPPAEFAGL